MAKVLVIDDEPTNVEALLDYFARCGVDYEYVSSLSEASEYLKEASSPYNAIVCDNHFLGSTVGGVDFLHMLAGRKRPAKGYEGIEKLANDYRGKTVLFSGSAVSERYVNPACFSDILVAQKQPDRGAEFCEREVIDALSTIGITFDASPESILEYKTSRGLEQGLDDHESSVRRFFEQAGLPADEIAQLCAEC